MQKPSFIKSRPRNSAMALQITSMADVFTIILVFLLKSYATSAINITPSSGLKLPVAQTDENQVEALKVEISDNAVQIDDTVATSLSHFHFNPKDVQANGVPLTLESALKARKKRQELIAKSNSDVKMDSKILVVADQHTPYLTLKSVLSAASLEGYTDFKLVVARKN